MTELDEAQAAVLQCLLDGPNTTLDVCVLTGLSSKEETEINRFWGLRGLGMIARVPLSPTTKGWVLTDYGRDVLRMRDGGTAATAAVVPSGRGAIPLLGSEGRA